MVHYMLEGGADREDHDHGARHQDEGARHPQSRGDPHPKHLKQRRH